MLSEYQRFYSTIIGHDLISYRDEVEALVRFSTGSQVGSWGIHQTDQGRKPSVISLFDVSPQAQCPSLTVSVL